MIPALPRNSQLHLHLHCTCCPPPVPLCALPSVQHECCMLLLARRRRSSNVAGRGNRSPHLYRFMARSNPELCGVLTWLRLPLPGACEYFCSVSYCAVYIYNRKVPTPGRTNGMSRDEDGWCPIATRRSPARGLRVGTVSPSPCLSLSSHLPLRVGRPGVAESPRQTPALAARGATRLSRPRTNNLAHDAFTATAMLIDCRGTG